MGSLQEDPDYSLTEEQKVHFLEHGYIKVPNCFTRAQATSFTSNLWTRLGALPTNKSTWTTERTNMPWHSHVKIEGFSPRAWSAMCQLLGGEERISEKEMYRGWSDGFIVNLGKGEYEEEGYEGGALRELEGWHNDGDFFVHFLDSPEQALLVIPLWSDIEPHGGGTALACDSIKEIAKYMYDHPEGCTPWMRSLHDPTHAAYEGRTFWQSLAADTTKISDASIVEVTGEIGDVFLLHPLMLHSASKNLLRKPRVITNPPVSLKEPFCFDREDPREYSLVEQKTLRDLGRADGLKGWRIQGERKGWLSSGAKKREAMRLEELERLRKLGGSLD